MNDLPAREAMEFDVVVVGAGPAGLAAAIRLKQLNPDLGVVVVEKGSEVGAHILSGAVIDPIGLDRLLPEWRGEDTPIKTPVTDDRFYWLGPAGGLRLPNFLLPPLMSNHGNFIVSLGNVCRWLATKAEALGVEIYPGFAAAEVLYGEHGEVVGVATGDMGVGKSKEHKDSFTRGMELRAKYTLFAEGARGSLSRQLIDRFELAKDREPQKFGIGLKELWKVAPEKHKPGLVQHSIRLAARQFDRRRLVSVPSRGPAGGGRLRGAPELPQSLRGAVRGIPALQAASAGAADLRGGKAHFLRGARDHRGRLAVGPEADLPGRRADRLRGGLHQSSAHQGFAQRDPVRDAGGRACRRRACARDASATSLPATRTSGAPPRSAAT